MNDEDIWRRACEIVHVWDSRYPITPTSYPFLGDPAATLAMLEWLAPRLINVNIQRFTHGSWQVYASTGATLPLAIAAAVCSQREGKGVTDAD